MKTLFVFLLSYFLSHTITAQAYYYQQSPGMMSILPTSQILPTTTITPNAIRVDTSFSETINRVFESTDRSPVTTGLLMDYGILTTNVQKYNGVLYDSNYLTYNAWQAMYLSLYSFRFNANSNTMLHPAQVADSVERYSASNVNTHTFVGLHFLYHKFRSDAVTSNLVAISDNKVLDVAGRPSSPYLQQEAFGITLKQAVLNGASHQFIFPKKLFFTNTGKTINTIQADLGDSNGWRNISFDNPISATYSVEGKKTIVFQITYSDNSIYTSHANIQINNIIGANPNSRYSNNTSVIKFPNASFATPIKTYQGVAGSATVTVGFSGADQVIRRPLIIAEGFDPWNILTPDDPSSNFSYTNLINDFNEPQSLDVRIFNSPNLTTLKDALNDDGYDIIFIDYSNGTDYIQRNAYLVENVIQWVNSVKQPYNGVMQKNVVMGFSMGGLVARYALRDMELNNVAHDTRLYISFDAPHQGANVPPAFQAMVAHLSDFSVGFGVPQVLFYNLSAGYVIKDLGRPASLLQTPAARQMLIQRVVATPQSSQLVYENSLHTTFMSEYKQMGYPQNGVRNIAIANGSECGSDQGFAPYAEFLNIDKSVDMPYWATLVTSLFGGLTNYPQLAFGSFLTTSSEIKAKFIANAIPNQQSKQIFYDKISIKKTILFAIKVEFTLDEFSFNSLPSQLPLDNAAGGSYNINDLAQDLPVELKIKQFCFVPTFSSLDIGAALQPITSSDLVASYNPMAPPAAPKSVPSSNFVTGTSRYDASANQTFSNEQHTQITQRSGNWLLKEIQGTPVTSSCAYACAGNNLSPVLSGPSVICTGSAQYTLSNVPGDASVIWSATANISINAAGYATTSGPTGSGTISAVISGACGLSPAYTLPVYWNTGNLTITGPTLQGPVSSQPMFSVRLLYPVPPTTGHFPTPTCHSQRCRM